MYHPWIENWPSEMCSVLEPLLQVWPPDRAMGRLVVEGPSPVPSEAISVVESLVDKPLLQHRPHLCAGLWLYVDELDRSHRISQGLNDPTGSFWHGIMHRREGDFSNSHHWMRQAGDDHPALEAMPEGYDLHGLIDRVAEAYRARQAPGELVDLQRQEWFVLMPFGPDTGQG